MSKKNPMLPGPLGGLPASGRTPKALQLKNYTKVLKLLDDSVEEAFDVIKQGLNDENVWVKIRCAEIILKKYLPDKKTKEIGGIGGGPVQITTTDKRASVIAIVNLLDEVGIEDLKEKAINGDFRIFESDGRAEDKQEKEMGGEEEADRTGD